MTFGVDLIDLIKAVGLIGLAFIVFAESGLLFGFFLPGDSLLFTAGFLASQGWFNVHLLAVILFVAAVLGDSVGYTFGRRVGKRIFKKEESILFHPDNIMRAEKFYERHGGKTIILARFIPMIRTFAPIVAGVGKMRYGKFVSYNIVGGALWAIGLTYLGFFVGSRIPDIDHYLLPVVLGIIVLSVLPPAIHLLKDAKNREMLKKQVGKAVRHLKGKIRRTATAATKD